MYYVHNASYNPVSAIQFRKCSRVHRMNTRFTQINFFIFPCYTYILLPSVKAESNVYLKKLRDDLYKSYV